MFPTDDQSSVPEDELVHAQDNPEPQTDETDVDETTATEEPPAPPTLTLEQVKALLDEQLKPFQQVLKQVGTYATREDVARAAQSASDKRFAALMKKLGPEYAGIDSAVKRGHMTEEDAKSAKREVLIELMGETFTAADEPDQPSTPALPPSLPQPPPAQKSAQQIAEETLQANGLTWDDMPEVANGKTLPLQQFLALVKQRGEQKRIEQAAEELLKKREAARVRQADAQGATRAPAAGKTPDKKQQLIKKYRNSGNIGAYLAEVEEGR